MSENTAPDTTLTLDVVAFDCPDARALGAFYAGLLGWEVEDDSDDDWVTLVPRAGRSPDRPAGATSGVPAHRRLRHPDVAGRGAPPAVPPRPAGLRHGGR